FDFPQMNPNCVERLDSTVAPQALYLMNNSMIEQLAAQFARRIEMEGEIGAERQIDHIYLIALSRYPRDEERSAGLRALAQLTAEWSEHLQSACMPGPAEATHRALASSCHAVINSASFVYID